MLLLQTEGLGIDGLNRFVEPASYNEWTAADFAVIIQFAGRFVSLGQRNLKNLETGGTGHSGGLHSKLLELVGLLTVSNWTLVFKLENISFSPLSFEKNKTDARFFSIFNPSSQNLW